MVSHLSGMLDGIGLQRSFAKPLQLQQFKVRSQLPIFLHNTLRESISIASPFTTRPFVSRGDYAASDVRQVTDDVLRDVTMVFVFARLGRSAHSMSSSHQLTIVLLTVQGSCFTARQVSRARPQVAQAMRRTDQAAEAAKRPVKAAQQTGLLQGLAAAQGRLNDSNVSWTTFLGLALLAGVTFGSVIQVSHNNPNLPVRLSHNMHA